jgi:rubrerythrin
MSVSETFDLAIQLEEKMSECYKAICKLCQDEAISKELVRLSYDEIAHADLLRTGKNYLKEVPDIFNLKSERMTELNTALNGIANLIESVREKNTNLKQAINDTAELERLFEQFHLKTIADVKDASLKKLFEALSTDDRVHARRLTSIMKTYESLS